MGRKWGDGLIRTSLHKHYIAGRSGPSPRNKMTLAREANRAIDERERNRRAHRQAFYASVRAAVVAARAGETTP